MKILLHVCCGPCTIYPLQAIRNQGHNVEGYFFNPNIHPYREFRRRINALCELSEIERFTVDVDNNYGLKDFMRRVVHHEQDRCSICYDMRLEKTAQRAFETGAEAFTTTLLYSRYQKHEKIREKGERLAEKFGVSFYYEDFRRGWHEGIELSKQIGLYRQPYCGCIFSEQERYDKSLRKKQKNNRKES